MQFGIKGTKQISSSLTSDGKLQCLVGTIIIHTASIRESKGFLPQDEMTMLGTIVPSKNIMEASTHSSCHGTKD